MRISTLWRYFFPRRRLYQRLPLPPLRYTSRVSVWGEVPEALKADAHRLMWGGVAVTEADAYRLLKKYPGSTVSQIVRKERRKRRTMSPIRRAWRRWKKVW